MRWAQRSYTHYYRADDAAAPGGLFGIVQGGMYLSLRLASLEALLRLPWPGLAIGGLAVGEPEEERLRVLETLLPSIGARRLNAFRPSRGNVEFWTRSNLVVSVP